MRVSIPIVLLMVAGTLGAQLPVGHSAGLVVTVDFDDDGTDDFMVVDGDLVAHGYEGFSDASLTSQPLGSDILADIPVVNGRTMFVTTIDEERSSIRVASFDIRADFSLAPQASTVYRAIEDKVAIARACPLNRDLDGDGGHDLLLAWTETTGLGTPGNSRNSTYYLLHASTASTLPQQVRMPRFVSEQQNGSPFSRSPKVVSLGRAVTPSLRTDEYLMGFSANHDEPLGGFGFILLYDGTTQAGGTWFSMLPTLLVDEFPNVEEESIAYGCFSPFPRFGVPLVKTSVGRSARLGLDPTEPFVARRGEVLHSTLRGKQLPRCIADYDDNGVQEMVWVDYVGNGPNPCLIIADPGPFRPYIHVLPLMPSAGGNPIHVHHGASGDFDGDGDPDIVLSVHQGNPQQQSGLIYIRTERDRRPGSATVLERTR